ncbi:ATP-binding protein, partial [Streptomyces sp. TRM76130]|nr:ATP-binding protein [Streptomyces sp. TRM76130]
DEASGRGLLIVAVLADRWGTVTRTVGKSVWCELDVRRATTPPPPAPRTP